MFFCLLGCRQPVSRGAWCPRGCLLDLPTCLWRVYRLLALIASLSYSDLSCLHPPPPANPQFSLSVNCLIGRLLIFILSWVVDLLGQPSAQSSTAFSTFCISLSWNSFLSINCWVLWSRFMSAENSWSPLILLQNTLDHNWSASWTFWVTIDLLA